MAEEARKESVREASKVVVVGAEYAPEKFALSSVDGLDDVFPCSRGQGSDDGNS